MRIALITRRNSRGGTGQYPAYGAWAEAEDILIDAVDCDVVSLTEPIEAPLIRLRRQGGRAARRVAGPNRSLPATPRFRSPLQKLNGRYDLAVFMAFSIWDLQLIESLGDLRSHADETVVWFLETWPSSYAGSHVRLEPFHTVDHIFVGMDAAQVPLSTTLSRTVDYLPIATDTIRFGPEQPDDPRPLDLIGLGRRNVDQHNAMLQWAAENNRLYLYDTAKVDVPLNVNRHRDTIGRWYSQSKLATCNYAKNDMVELIGNLKIMPGRLWEGLASGAALIGLPPDETSQHNLFARTVVTPVPDDPTDLPMFLERTIAEHGSEKVAANVSLALRGHDWAHRWQTMFETLGLATPSGLQARIDQLAVRAKGFS